jgi:hypothetical protein
MTEGKGESVLHGVSMGVAIAVIAAWLAMLVWLALHTPATEIVWARMLSVLSSIEAVAFAAAGALFGTTIQKKRVDDAKGRADQAEERASRAEKDSAANLQNAANGKALATVIKARRKVQPASPAGLERVSSAQQPDAASDELVALADQLFPGVGK